MSKYLVETYYTCTFKIVHKLDELNEKKLGSLNVEILNKLSFFLNEFKSRLSIFSH